MAQGEQLQWHRWFGLGWTDLFVGQPVRVDLEKDLSLKHQYLDVVLVRRDTAQPLSVELPDGFDPLAAHNLISFKSFQEEYDLFALCELIGHFANYCKQASPAMDDLLPLGDFRLFAVSVRRPRKLTGEVNLVPVSAGVYDIPLSKTLRPRLVVVHELPQLPRNAMLHLFSFKEELCRYGGANYHPRSKETSSFLHQLIRRYQQEGIEMPFTVEEFNRQLVEEIIRELPEEKRLQLVRELPADKLLEGVSVEKRLESVPVEKRLESVPVEKRLESVPVEKRLESVPVEKRLEGVSPDELLRALSPEAIEELRRRLQVKDSSSGSA
ncbi:MAG: hypothetical protein U0797_16750 [Gemmataceae bacterium]